MNSKITNVHTYTLGEALRFDNAENVTKHENYHIRSQDLDYL